jgi:hypothetical protein
MSREKKGGRHGFGILPTRPRAPLQGADEVWVGIVFQGDSLTKITLRSHRSRPWREENPQDLGPNGDSIG